MGFLRSIGRHLWCLSMWEDGLARRLHSQVSFSGFATGREAIIAPLKQCTAATSSLLLIAEILLPRYQGN
jgi:hypothetical protein